jgi:carboxypeptidase Q
MEAIERLTQLAGGGESPAPVLQPPKRTLRTIHWAAEEWGSQGAADYWDSGVQVRAPPSQQFASGRRVCVTLTPCSLMQDSTKVSLGMGDDNGAFTPTSFAFTGNDEARAIIEAIVFMLNENGIDVDVTVGGGFEGSGQVPAVPRGTVDNNGGNPNWEESGDAFRGNYFFFHHTEADTMTVIDSDDMDTNTAMYAAIAYVVADLDELLPRDPDAKYLLCTPTAVPVGSFECS